jgi:hypothetical protein
LEVFVVLPPNKRTGVQALKECNIPPSANGISLAIWQDTHWFQLMVAEHELYF